MIDLFASPWIPAAVLLLLTCGARLLCGGWLAPSAFAGLLWSTFVWGSVLVTDFPIHASAIWVIVLFVFALQLGAFIGGNIVCKPPSEKIAQGNERGTAQSLCLTTLRFSGIFAILAFAGAVYFVYWSFWRFDLPASPVSFLAVGHLWSVQYGDYGEVEPWLVRLTIMWVYPAALLGGMAFATASNRKEKFFSLSPLLPSLLVGSAVAARSGILLSCICWISGYLGIRNWQSKGAYPLFRRRSVLVLTALGAGAVILFVLVDALRQSQDGQTFDLALDSPRLLKYSLGSLAGFSSWFHQHVPGHPLLGAYTFSGFFDLLGLHHREIGLYQSFESLSGGLETNIYTAVRGFIQDFGLAGTVCISFIVGLVSSMFFNHSSQKEWTTIVFGSAFYAFVLASPITSIFTYNGLLLAWVVAALVLKFSFRPVGMRTSTMSYPILPQRLPSGQNTLL